MSGAERDATACRHLVGLAHVAHDRGKPLTDPGFILSISGMPVPIRTGQAEPAGVSWTILRVLLTRVSWSI
ncbi:MAG: hypothetical protein ACJ754_08505 [Pyrinomonadaceae bacterium]